jgi:predicted neuraminidase
MKLAALLTLAIAVRAQTSEFVADTMPTPSCHASTIVELRPGELMAAWFGGTAERNPNVAIYGTRKHDGRWDPPVELVREPNIATWNPVLFRTGDGVLWLYYKFGPSPQQWTAGRLFSSDDGRTWSAPEHLPAGVYGPIRAKPLVLPGLIVSGTSVESYQSWASWIERSTDNGKTWTRHGPIIVPNAGTGGIIQPVVVPMGGKRLRFFARSTIGRVFVSDSDDLGITWTTARPTDLPNPSAGIDVVRLKDSRFVMIYNHTERGRTPLNLAVSKDGEHWTMFHALETDPGEYSYPAMVQSADGSLHMTYTWHRQKVKYVNWPLSKVGGQ